MAIIDLLKADKRVKKLNKMLDNGSFALDTDMRIREMLTSHKVKKLRRLTTRHVLERFQEKVITAMLENQAFRSRVVEIYTECIIISGKLEEHLRGLKGYLKSKYSDQIKKNGYSTVADKNSLIDAVLEPAIVRQHELKQVISVAKLIQEDLDQGGWSVKNLIEAIGVINARNTHKI
jgi:hypothetical protein